MAQLNDHLRHVQPGRTYDEVELAALQRVFERVCSHLEVSETQQTRRETIAIVLFQAAEQTLDEDTLFARIVRLFVNRG